MAVSDGDTVMVVKDMGLVATVFDERTLSGLQGHLAIGHTRYSTHGASDWAGAQPVYRPVGRAGFALGHNGNLTNTAALAEKVGMLPGSVATDSDVVAELAGRTPSPRPRTWRPRCQAVLPDRRGRVLLGADDARSASSACATRRLPAAVPRPPRALPTPPRGGCWPRNRRRSASSAPPSCARWRRASWS